MFGVFTSTKAQSAPCGVLGQLGKAAQSACSAVKQQFTEFSWPMMVLGGVGAVAVYKSGVVGWTWKSATSWNFRRLAVACSILDPLEEIDVPRTKTTVMESVRSGSVETKLLAPKCQTTVGYLEDGKYKVVGCAVRIDDDLVILGHVASAPPKGQAVLKGHNRYIALDLDKMEALDTDVYALSMDDRMKADAGLKVMHAVKAIPVHGMHCQIVGPAGLGTTGIIRHDAAIFGRITYDGTTVAGYSGAAYTAGNILVGIHTSGGSVNAGYNASYLRICIQAKNKKVDESEEWLREQWDNGAEFWVDDRWYDDDYSRIKVGGAYHLVQRSSMRNVFGDQWEEDFHNSPSRMRKKNKKRHEYTDYESIKVVPGETIASTSGASTLLEKSPGSADLAKSGLMTVLSKLSNRQVKQLKSLLIESQKLSDSQANAQEMIKSIAA